MDKIEAPISSPHAACSSLTLFLSLRVNTSYLQTISTPPKFSPWDLFSLLTPGGLSLADAALVPWWLPPIQICSGMQPMTQQTLGATRPGWKMLAPVAPHRWHSHGEGGRAVLGHLP